MATPKTSGVLAWIRANWATISALIVAIAAVLWPGSEDVAAKVLTILASVLGATGMGMLAARSEARKLGLVAARPRV